jgi:hypothetical protein
MSRGAAGACVVALQFVTLFLGILAIAACSEATSDACDRLTGSSVQWFAAVLWPTALFAGGQLVPWLRSRNLALLVVTVILAAGFWALVLLSVP